MIYDGENNGYMKGKGPKGDCELVKAIKYLTASWIFSFFFLEGKEMTEKYDGKKLLHILF